MVNILRKEKANAISMNFMNVCSIGPHGMEFKAKYFGVVWQDILLQR